MAEPSNSNYSWMSRSSLTSLHHPDFTRKADKVFRAPLGLLLCPSTRPAEALQGQQGKSPRGGRGWEPRWRLSPELSRELAERRVVCSPHCTSRTHRPFGKEWSPQPSEHIFPFESMHQRLILWKVSSPKRIWSNPNYSWRDWFQWESVP